MTFRCTRCRPLRPIISDSLSIRTILQREVRFFRNRNAFFKKWNRRGLRLGLYYSSNGKLFSSATERNSNVKQIKRFVILFMSVCAAMASVADTYYWFGKPDAADTTFEGTTKVDATYGWSLDPNTTKAKVAHTVSAEHDYVLQDYNTSYTRVKMTASGCQFKGRTLTLIGTLPLCSGSGKLVCPKIIGGEYLDQTTATIGNWLGKTTMEVDADFQIDEGKAIGFRNVPNAGEERNTVLGTSANKITGAGSLMLAGSGNGNAYYEILCDASEFTGTIDVGYVGILPATPTRAPGPANLTFKLSGPFGGTVTDLPDNTKEVRVNYDGLPQGKGLRVKTTKIPTALKTKLYLWSSTADFSAKNFPLLTFPAGTGISTAEFKVYHCTSKTTTAKTQFENLGVQVNTDGSMTLVANFEGQTIELNSWTSDPVLTKTSWMVRDDEPGELTPPVAKYGAETMTTTMNGATWDGTMPTTVGSYTVEWKVAETADYTGITISRTFAITEFVDPVNSNLRYFAANGKYWKPASAMKEAIEALPAAGGIIEFNVDLLDTQSINNYYFDKPIVLRSSTHESRIGQRFTFKYNQPKIVVKAGALSVSNLVLDVSALINVSLKTAFQVEGGCLTFEAGTAVNVPQELVWSSEASVILGSSGSSLDLAGPDIADLDLGGMALFKLAGSTLTIRPGTRFAGLKCSSVIAADSSSRVSIVGGVITNNVISSNTGAAVNAAGEVRIQGSPIVWANTKANGAQANVKPVDANKIKLSGDLGADAKVGVSFGSAAGDAFGVVVAGDPGRGFVCDQNAQLYGTVNGDGKLCWTSGKHGLVIFFGFH